MIAFVSGSEPAARPGKYVPRAPRAQRYGKFRLRSTPRAFCRVFAARPSGLAVRTSQNATPSRRADRSRATIASPAGSLP